MKKKLVIGLLVLALVCFGIWYITDSKKSNSKLRDYYKNETTYLKKKNNNPEYFNYEGVEYKRVKLDEAKKIKDKYKAICGLTKMDSYSREEDINSCFENIGYNSIVYIEKGTPHYMRASVDCNNKIDEDESDGCKIVDGYYDIAKVSFVDNAKNIISRINQFNGTEFLFETTNGDVYYFNPLESDDKAAAIVKVSLPSKLKSFNNVEDAKSPYGTDIVLVLEDNNKYVVKYNYKTSKIFLVKYDDYVSGNYDNMTDSTGMQDEFDEISIDSKIEEKPYTGRIQLDKVKNELSKKNYVLNIGNSKFEDTYGTLGIEDGKVIFEINYPNKELVNEEMRFIIDSIPSPVGIYMPQGIGGNEDYVVEFYVINSQNDIYIVNFILRDPNSNKNIYKIK